MNDKGNSCRQAHPNTAVSSSALKRVAERSAGFYDECSWVVGTSATLKCFTPELLEYLHAVVIAGGHVCNRPLKL